jgi:enterochelin esterase-like enzyme
VDSAFSTRPEREHTFIAGSSMGGLISMYAICEYPEVFGAAACLSTHWIGVWDDLDNPIPETFAAYLKEHLPEPGEHRFYFDHGTETLDQWYGRGQALVDIVMEEAGYGASDWKTLVFEGTDHSENAWAERLQIPLQFLLAPRQD